MLIEVELLTDQGNGAVVRLPARKYPGVLIQGDTLDSFASALAEAVEALQRNDLPEAQAAILALASAVNDLKANYEAALRAHGVHLPYGTGIEH